MAKFSITAFITANTKEFIAGLADAQSSLTKFSANLKKTLLAVGSFTVALKGVSSVTKFVTEATSEFAKANSNIVKGTGATGVALQNLSKSVRNAMKNGVGRSASEVGEMVADLNTRFGVTGEKLEKLVDEFDKYSDVTGVDTKQSIESLADVMAKWNVEASETDELMDQLVYASQASGLSVTELTSALKSGETTFNAFGMSITDSIGFLSQLKTQGVDTTSALSALKIGMAKFAASGEDVGEQFRKVSSQIQNATSDSEALQIAVTNFGAKGGSELVKVFKNNGLEKFISQLENAKGTLDNTEKASRTSADAFEDLKAQIQATFFSGSSDSYLTQIIDEIKIGFTEIDDDAMYNVFNNLYKAVQICVNSINALIHGDWETLWDYAKLVVLKLVNSVSEALQKMVDDLGIKVNVAAGVIGGLATGFGILTGNLAVAAAGVGVAVGTIIATNKTAMEQVSKDTQAEIDKTEKEIIARTQKNAEDGSEQLLKDLKRTQADIKNQTEKTGELIENSVVPNEKSIKKRLDGFTKGVKKGLDSIIGEYEGIEDSTEAYNKLLENMGQIVTEQTAVAFKDMFKELGEGLADGELAFENMGATAVNAVSEILAALGSQLMAIAALKASNQDYASAAIATAGAAAAFTASGVLAGVASNMKKSADSMKDAASSLASVLKTITEIKDELSFSSLYSSLVDYNNLLEEAIETQEEWQWYFENTLNAFNFKYIKENLEDSVEAVEEIENAIAKIYTDTIDNLNEENDALQKQIEFYQDMYNNLYMIDIVEGTMRSSLKNMIVEAWADVANIGSNIGEAFIDAFLDGASEADFASSLKDLIRTNLIKTSVLTTELEEQIAESSTRLVTAITNKNYEEIESISDYMRGLYREYENVADGIDEVLNGIFEDTVETVESITDSIEEMGTTISESLVDAMVNGLEQGEFLDTMKNYVRKMVVQTVVYTESLQSQIEAIGVAISEGIANGFSESGLDKLRMDFSYLFYQAENSMSKIDSVLNAVFDGYATGTDNATAGLHLVGEAGPELVRFRGGEQVYNASETAKMLNGGNSGNNFNVSFYNMQDTTAYTMLQQLKQYNREMAINGIL